MDELVWMATGIYLVVGDRVVLLLYLGGGALYLVGSSKNFSIMKLLSLMLVLIIMASCESRIPAKENIKNGEYTIEFLFEHDGCKMYRFDDGVRYVYWSDCRGKVNADYEKRTSTGKTTTTRHYKEETITDR